MLHEGSREHTTMLYYKGLIEMRKSFDIFTNLNTQILSAEELGSGILAVVFDDGLGGQALVLVNPQGTNLPYALEGQWNLVADANSAGSAVLAQESGSVTVESLSVRVYVNDKLAS